jgi:muramoyltetrapeptide carboxypeptidase
MKNLPVNPERLSRGNTVGIIAPASHFDKNIFNHGISVLKFLGFSVSVPNEIFGRQDYFAGSDRQRAQIVNQQFSDPDVKALFCARGGYGSIRILDFLDFESIKKNPKVIVGFSDVSALLAGLYMQSHIITFHGPTVTQLAHANAQTIQAMMSVLSSNDEFEVKPTNGVTIQSGVGYGPVAGGNLTTLCHLIGTEYQPDFKGHIFLLEDRGETPYRIDRMLTQMKLAKCLDQVVGVILGSFEECGRIDKIYRIITDILGNSRIPVLAGFDIGHGHTNITIPLGMKAFLDADRQRLLYL